MRRCRGKLLGQLAQINAVFLIESAVADLMLLAMVAAYATTKRSRPFVRRLLAHPAACVHPHMRCFARNDPTARDGARKRSDPSQMLWAPVGVFPFRRLGERRGRLWRPFPLGFLGRSDGPADNGETRRFQPVHEGVSNGGVKRLGKRKILGQRPHERRSGRSA